MNKQAQPATMTFPSLDPHVGGDEEDEIALGWSSVSNSFQVDHFDLVERIVLWCSHPFFDDMNVKCLSLDCLGFRQADGLPPLLERHIDVG